MSYLVDANVLSEATKPNPDGKVVEWLRDNEREIVIDPIILGEIQFGILVLLAQLSLLGANFGNFSGFATREAT